VVGRISAIDSDFDVIRSKSLDVMHAMFLDAYRTTIRLCLENLDKGAINRISEVTRKIQRQGELASEIDFKLTGKKTILDAFAGSPKGTIHLSALCFLLCFRFSNLASFIQNWILFPMILACRGNVSSSVLDLFNLIKSHLISITKTIYTDQELGMDLIDCSYLIS
jgi:hypothetical protein